MLLSQLLSSDGDRFGLPLFLVIVGAAGTLVIALYGFTRIAEILRRGR